jgi:hypothetical protein
MLVKGDVLRLVRIVVEMNPCGGQFDAPESDFKRSLENQETGVRVDALDIYGVPTGMGGIVHSTDCLIVRRTTVGGRQYQRDTSTISNLIKHHEQVLIHVLNAATASVLATEFTRREMAKRNLHKKSSYFWKLGASGGEKSTACWYEVWIIPPFIVFRLNENGGMPTGRAL